MDIFAMHAYFTFVYCISQKHIVLFDMIFFIILSLVGCSPSFVDKVGSSLMQDIHFAVFLFKDHDDEYQIFSSIENV